MRPLKIKFGKYDGRSECDYRKQSYLNNACSMWLQLLSTTKDYIYKKWKSAMVNLTNIINMKEYFPLKSKNFVETDFRIKEFNSFCVCFPLIKIKHVAAIYLFTINFLLCMCVGASPG